MRVGSWLCFGRSWVTVLSVVMDFNQPWPAPPIFMRPLERNQPSLLDCVTHITHITCTHTHIFTHTHIYIYTYRVYIYIYISYIYIYVYTYIYLSIYLYIHTYIYIWANWNISLPWTKAICGWFPLLTMIPSEVAVRSLKFTHIYIYMCVCVIATNLGYSMNNWLAIWSLLSTGTHSQPLLNLKAGDAAPCHTLSKWPSTGPEKWERSRSSFSQQENMRHVWSGWKLYICRYVPSSLSLSLSFPFSFSLSININIYTYICTSRSLSLYFIYIYIKTIYMYILYLSLSIAIPKAGLRASTGGSQTPWLSIHKWSQWWFGSTPIFGNLSKIMSIQCKYLPWTFWNATNMDHQMEWSKSSIALGLLHPALRSRGSTVRWSSYPSNIVVENGDLT